MTTRRAEQGSTWSNGNGRGCDDPSPSGRRPAGGLGPLVSSVAVYAACPNEAAKVLPRVQDLVAGVFETIGEFELKARHCRTGLVVLGEQRAPGRLDIPGLSKSFPGGLVVVAPLRIEWLRELEPIQSPRVVVVWTDEVGHRLSGLLARMAQDPLSVGLRSLAERGVTPRVIDRALSELGMSAPPLRSVEELAETVSVSAGALRYYWRKRFGDSLPLKNAVGWTILLRALEARESTNWVGVAYRFGIHARTLERLSRRLSARTLSQAFDERHAVFEDFEQMLRETVRAP